MITFKRIVCFASVAALLFFLSACETTPTVHRPGETPQIHKRVALLEIEEPMVYDIRIMQSMMPDSPGLTLPGRVVGLGMVTMMKTLDQGQRNRALTKALDFWKFKISEHLTDDITRELEKIGYEVVVVKPEYRRRARFVDKYPKAPKPVDAYVDLVVQFAGYVAGKPDLPFVPTVEVPFKVVSSWNNEVIHQGTLIYGGPVPVTGPTDMPADPQHNVRGFDNLCATDCEVSPAVKGLTAASEGIAKLLSQHIR